MSQVYLRRSDPAANMARFYLMSVQPTLFGEWELAREWGRIAAGGQVLRIVYPTLDEAAAALTRLWRVKFRRGYRLHRAAPYTPSISGFPNLPEHFGPSDDGH